MNFKSYAIKEIPEIDDGEKEKEILLKILSLKNQNSNIVKIHAVF